MSLPQAGLSVITTALAGLGGAASIAALALAIDTCPWRGRFHRARGFGPPMALGCATAVCFGLTRDWPAFPPRQTLHWLFYVALASACLGAGEAIAARSSNWIRALLALALPMVLLEFQRRLHWERIEGILWTAGLGVALFGSWSALAWHEARGPGDAARTLGWALATALAAATISFAGGGVFAQCVGALALALGLCALLGLWRRSPGLGAPGVAPYVLLHTGMVWAARYLYELSTSGFVLLSVAPLAVLVERLVPASHPRKRRTVAVLGPSVIAGIALALERASAPPPSPYG